MNMESNNEKARKLTLQAKHILWRYVLFLVVTYVGFVVMTSLIGDFSDPELQSIFYIEIGLFVAIVSVLWLAIYKALRAVRLFKKKEEWR